MNSMLRKYIAVEGREAALKMASALLEQNYQVMIQLDDCNIYIVAYEYNDPGYGDNQFASLSPDEMEELQFKRDEAKYRESVNFVNVHKDQFEAALEPDAANEMDDDDDDEYDDDDDDDDDYDDSDDDDDCCSDFSEYHSIS